jgi:hypothetical protein
MENAKKWLNLSRKLSSTKTGKTGKNGEDSSSNMSAESGDNVQTYLVSKL